MTAAGAMITAQFTAMDGATFLLVPSFVASAENCEKARIPADAELPGGGHSQIYGRAGSPLAKPSGPHEGGIPYAETDLADIEVAKHFLDTVRHYARPDLLSLKVNAGPVKHVYRIVVAGLIAPNAV